MEWRLSLNEKECFKCKVEKPLSEFYKHPQMADGRLNKCKQCNKADVIANRLDKVDYYRAYDKDRGARQTAEYIRKYREKNPQKHKAHAAVNYAIRSKKLFHEDCEVCGREDTHAHHDDYAKPLNVRWLCPPHHFEWHKENGEGLNGK
jgi:hypothetical protein